MKNLLINSDNIIGLNYLLNQRNLKGKIDLIYIDPPFATGIDFIITNNRATTISSSKKGNIAYSDKLIGIEYLNFLKERLILLKELMSENGSIYLHIDYKIGHYVKILMDEVFGIDNFRNDITRIKCNPKNFKKIGYGNIKDLILFYSKSKHPIWNEPKEKYSEKDLVKLFPKIDNLGRRYTTVPIHAPGETKNGNSNKMFKGKKPPVGRHWRVDVSILEEWDSSGLIEWSNNGNPRKIIYADESEGKRVQDIWEFKDPQYPVYPTEKNINLLNQIIKTSSNQNSIVLDCFCGSGTTLKSSQLNNRNWIGVDSSSYAIEIAKKKIKEISDELFSDNNEFEYIELQTS